MVTAKPDKKLKHELERKRSALNRRAVSLAGRDIGRLPPVRDPHRKLRALQSLEYYLPAYYPQTFDLPFSNDHRRLIRKIEDVILGGGLLAAAMPRGTGKTQIVSRASLWALKKGRHEFVVPIGATETDAESMLATIQTEIETNPLLLEDWPEIAYPIRCLEGISQRKAGQLYQGQPTHIDWTCKRIVLPSMPDSPASAGIIEVRGITGRIRGMHYLRPDGRTVRPTLAIVDDAQTRESAKSPSQCEDREKTIMGDILGLAGPGQSISCVMPCTVIRKGDLADRMLNHSLHPEWNGIRTKMVYSWPTNEALWAQYGEIRAESFRAGNQGREATEFYGAHRAEMDEGSEIAWPERFEKGELSALQHAMNLRLRDEAAMFAEHQNEPLDEYSTEGDDLTAIEIADRINRIPRAIVPAWADIVTAMVDVQRSALYFAVAAFRASDFTGAVIDYGAWPDQGLPYFTLKSIRKTIAKAFPQAGLEGQLFGALTKLTDRLSEVEWKRQDGTTVRLNRGLADCGWMPDTIYQVCRQSKHSALWLPSQGKGIGAAATPMSEYRRNEGEQHGGYWLIGPTRANRAIRRVAFDANYWKTFAHARLATTIGDRGALTLFGDRADVHRMLSEHCVAEYRVRVRAKDRTVDEWKEKPERFDNHLLDCLVGCYVAASICGATLAEGQAAKKAGRRKPRIKYLKA